MAVKLMERFFDEGIVPYKDYITLPPIVLGQALKYGAQNWDTNDGVFTKMAFLDSELQKKMRDNIQGGLAQVNVRYAKVCTVAILRKKNLKVNETKIRE